MNSGKNIENEIIKLFLHNESLKFNQIGKLLKTRTNKISYHIKNLVSKGILVKTKKGDYKLSETAEHLIPYISERKHALPVILIHIGNKKEAYLYKRQKRPFRNLLSMPGGRLGVNESIEEASKRIMKEKFNTNITDVETKSISLEHVRKNNQTNHSFLLITIKAKTKDKIELTDVEKNKNKIISSDYKLIKENKRPSEIKEIKTEIK